MNFTLRTLIILFLFRCGTSDSTADGIAQVTDKPGQVGQNHTATDRTFAGNNQECAKSEKIHVSLSYVSNEILHEKSFLENPMAIEVSPWTSAPIASPLTATEMTTVEKPQLLREDFLKRCTSGMKKLGNKFMPLAMFKSPAETIRLKATPWYFDSFIDITITRQGKATETESELTTEGLPELMDTNVRLHRMRIADSDKSIHLKIWRNNPDFALLVVLLHERLPTTADFKYAAVVVPTRATREYFLNFYDDTQNPNLFGEYIVGLMPYTKQVADQFGRHDSNLAFDNHRMVATLNYLLSVAVSSCSHFNEDLQVWKQEICQTKDSKFCHCKHMYEGQGEFFEVPGYPLSKSSSGTYVSNGQWVIFAVLTVVWLIYIIWTYWYAVKDRWNINEKSTIVMKDHKMSETHPYVVEVFTGLRQKGGTTASVWIQLHGARHDSRMRKLTTKQKSVFSRGGEDRFLLKAENTLGPIRAITIAHDNKGPRPRWYLHQVRVYDVTTRNYWVFLIDEWLDGDGKGSIYEYYEPLSPEDFKNFFVAFQLRATRIFRDKHLWSSLFSCPPRSNFTRPQRLTIIISTLLFTMMINILLLKQFYPELPSLKNQSALFVISLIIGVGAAGISFVYRCVVDRLFRYATRRYTDWLHDGIRWNTIPQTFDTPTSSEIDQRVELLFQRASEVALSSNPNTMKETSTSNISNDAVLLPEIGMLINPSYSTDTRRRLNSIPSFPGYPKHHEGKVIVKDGTAKDTETLESEADDGVVVRELKLATTLSIFQEYMAWCTVIIASIVSSIFTATYAMSYGMVEYITWYLATAIAFALNEIILEALMALSFAIGLSCYSEDNF